MKGTTGGCTKINKYPWFFIWRDRFLLLKLLILELAPIWLKFMIVEAHIHTVFLNYLTCSKKRKMKSIKIITIEKLKPTIFLLQPYSFFRIKMTGFNCYGKKRIWFRVSLVYTTRKTRRLLTLPSLRLKRLHAYIPLACSAVTRWGQTSALSRLPRLLEWLNSKGLKAAPS